MLSLSATDPSMIQSILSVLLGGGTAGIVIALINQAFRYKNNRQLAKEQMQVARELAVEKTNAELMSFWREQEEISRKERSEEMNRMRASMDAQLVELTRKHNEDLENVRKHSQGERVSLDLTIASLGTEMRQMTVKHADEALAWQTRHHSLELKMEQAERQHVSEKLAYLENISNRFETFCQDLVGKVAHLYAATPVGTAGSTPQEVEAAVLDTVGDAGGSPG